jgi:hypothetical protein
VEQGWKGSDLQDLSVRIKRGNNQYITLKLQNKGPLGEAKWQSECFLGFGIHEYEIILRNTKGEEFRVEADRDGKKFLLHV